jgi:hypothetical protein
LVWVVVAIVVYLGRAPGSTRSGPTHRYRHPHSVSQFSGHRTRSTLDRYHLIDLDDLRVAAERASDFLGTRRRVATLHGEQPQ